MSWNELWEYVAELLREPGSHLVAAMNGDRYITEPGERAAWDVFELWLNAQPGRRGKKPLKRPWAGKAPTYKLPTPTATPERAKRKAKLEALF